MEVAMVVKLVLLTSVLLAALMFGGPSVFLLVAVWVALISMRL